MRAKRRKKVIFLGSLGQYSDYLKEISELSKSDNGNILVNSQVKMLSLDNIVKNLKISSKSTDAIHFNMKKKILYIIEFKDGSILFNKKNLNCNHIERDCDYIKREEKSKREEIKAKLALKGIDTYLIALKNILTKYEYELIIRKKIKVEYIIVNSYPDMSYNPQANKRRQERIRTLSYSDSINFRIPDCLKRYKGHIFNEVILESSSFFKREILPKII